MIRFITSFILSLIVAYCSAQSANLDINSNATLSYSQLINGVNSGVTVTINKDASLAAPKISWSVRSGDKSNSRIYNYSATSITNSNILYLKMDESFIPVADADIALISKKVFEEITKGKTMFRINGGIVNGFEVLDKEKTTVKVNGTATELEAYHLQSLGGGPVQELWILNNANNPILLKASGVFNLELTEVKL